MVASDPLAATANSTGPAAASTTTQAAATVTTTKAELMRIQQQNIDALKSYTVGTTHAAAGVPVATRAVASSPPAKVKTPPPVAARPPPPSAARAPPPTAAKIPPGAVSIDMPPNAAPAPQRLDELSPACYALVVIGGACCYCLIFLVFCAIIGGLLVWGAQDVYRPNTPTLAFVTSIAPSVSMHHETLVCAVNLTFAGGHSGAWYNTSGLLEADLGMCEQKRVGSGATVCYCWSTPNKAVVGECEERTYSYPHARRVMTAGIVFFYIGAAPCACWAVCTGLWLVWCLGYGCWLCVCGCFALVRGARTEKEALRSGVALSC